MMSSTKTITVTHHFKAPAEQVFDAWLNPKKAKKFLFTTPTGTMVRTEIDAHVGGSFILTDRRDGEDVEHTGEYIEILRPRRLVFTFCVPKYSKEITHVTIDILPQEKGCDLTLTHEGVLADYEKRTQDGWNKILSILATQL